MNCIEYDLLKKIYSAGKKVIYVKICETCCLNFWACDN